MVGWFCSWLSEKKTEFDPGPVDIKNNEDNNVIASNNYEDFNTVIKDDYDESNEDDKEEEEVTEDELLEMCVFPDWVVSVGTFHTITHTSKYEFVEDGSEFYRSNFSYHDKVSHRIAVTKCRQMVDVQDEMVKMVVKVTTASW